MPPTRRERIEREKRWESAGKTPKQIRLEPEFQRLLERESEERKARIIQQESLNSQIESLVDKLKQAEVSIKVVKKEKAEKKNVQKGPPVFEVTTEVGPEAARSSLAFFDSQAGKRILQRLKALGISPKGGRATSTSKGHHRYLRRRRSF